MFRVLPVAIAASSFRRDHVTESPSTSTVRASICSTRMQPLLKARASAANSSRWGVSCR
jgi:hypothetical protein